MGSGRRGVPRSADRGWGGEKRQAGAGPELGRSRGLSWRQSEEAGGLDWLGRPEVVDGSMETWGLPKEGWVWGGLVQILMHVLGGSRFCSPRESEDEFKEA